MEAKAKAEANAEAKAEANAEAKAEANADANAEANAEAKAELGKISSYVKDAVKDSLPPGKWFGLSYEEKLAAVKRCCTEGGEFEKPPPHKDMHPAGTADKQRDPDRCDYAGGGGWYGQRA